MDFSDVESKSSESDDKSFYSEDNLINDMDKMSLEDDIFTGINYLIDSKGETSDDDYTDYIPNNLTYYEYMSQYKNNKTYLDDIENTTYFDDILDKGKENYEIKKEKLRIKVNQIEEEIKSLKRKLKILEINGFYDLKENIADLEEEISYQNYELSDLIEYKSIGFSNMKEVKNNCMLKEELEKLEEEIKYFENEIEKIENEKKDLETNGINYLKKNITILKKNISINENFLMHLKTIPGSTLYEESKNHFNDTSSNFFI